MASTFCPVCQSVCAAPAVGGFAHCEACGRSFTPSLNITAEAPTPRDSLPPLADEAPIDEAPVDIALPRSRARALLPWLFVLALGAGVIYYFFSRTSSLPRGGNDEDLLAFAFPECQFLGEFDIEVKDAAEFARGMAQFPGQLPPEFKMVLEQFKDASKAFFALEINDRHEPLVLLALHMRDRFTPGDVLGRIRDLKERTTTASGAVHFSFAGGGFVGLPNNRVILFSNLPRDRFLAVLEKKAGRTFTDPVKQHIAHLRLARNWMLLLTRDERNVLFPAFDVLPAAPEFQPLMRAFAASSCVSLSLEKTARNDVRLDLGLLCAAKDDADLAKRSLEEVLNRVRPDAIRFLEFEFPRFAPALGADAALGPILAGWLRRLEVAQDGIFVHIPLTISEADQKLLEPLRKAPG